MNDVVCNLCGHNEPRLLFQLPDWQTKRKDVIATIVECGHCGLIYQNPQPGGEEFDTLYPASYECYQSGMDPQTLNPLARLGAVYGMWKRSKLVLRAQKSGRLLDVGCATGVFLKEMTRWPNWELYGVEPHAASAQRAQKVIGESVSVGTLGTIHYPDCFFDVVTLWDVLEHLPDPDHELAEIYRILKPGGSIVIRVPNGSSWEKGIFNKYWAGFEPPRHFYVFDPQSLKNYLRSNHFSIQHMGCDFGGYLSFLLSLRFYMKDQMKSSVVAESVLKFLGSPPIRLLAAPVFWLLSLGLHGPSLNVTAQKAEG